MFLEVVLSVVLILILFGLTKSTESVLDIRQSRRDHGYDSKTYL